MIIIELINSANNQKMLGSWIIEQSAWRIRSNLIASYLNILQEYFSTDISKTEVISDGKKIYKISLSEYDNEACKDILNRVDTYLSSIGAVKNP